MGREADDVGNDRPASGTEQSINPSLGYEHQVDDVHIPAGKRVSANDHKLEVHWELSPTSPGPPLSPFPASEPHRPNRCAKVRPSWACRKNRERLTEDGGKKCNEKILSHLRERLGEEGCFSYTLHGECYIHGVMDGEAILYQNEGDDKVVPSMLFEIL